MFKGIYTTKKGTKFKSNTKQDDILFVPKTKKEFNEFIDTLYNEITNPTEVQTNNYHLVKEYPYLLTKHGYDSGLRINNDNFEEDLFSSTYLDWVPKGWREGFGLQFVKELTATIPEGYLYEYYILDIKEKWGGLRWYDFGFTDEMEYVKNKFEDLSFFTCIISGTVATHTTTGWIVPVNIRYYKGDAELLPINAKEQAERWEAKYNTKVKDVLKE